MKRALSLVLGALGVIALAGFTLEYTAPGGVFMYWTTRTPHFSVNIKGSAHLTGQAQFTAVANAFTAWSTPTCTDMAPVDDGTTPRFDVTYNPDAGMDDPNVNLVVWRPAICSMVAPDAGGCVASTSCDDTYNCLDDGDSEAIALTTLFARSDTGGILQAGTELNDYYYVFTTVSSPSCDYACSDAGTLPDGGACGALPPTVAQAPTAVNWPCVVFDVQEVMTHEAGHFLGFGESLSPTSVMYTLAAAGDASKRALGADDQNAVCTLYPRGEPTPALDGGAEDGGEVSLPSPGCGCSPASSGGSGELSLWAVPLVGFGLARHRRRR